MLIELNKTDFEWLRDFLNNYVYLMKSHVYSGSPIPDQTKERMYEIIAMEPIKSGTYFIGMNDKEAEFFLELLDKCMCACPGCTVSNVKHRKNISNIILRAITPDTSEV